MKIFQSNTIYRLYDIFVSHQEQIKIENRAKYQELAVFPCRLKILSECIFKTRNPIICGVLVEDGRIKIGTPICVPSKNVCIKFNE